MDIKTLAEKLQYVALYTAIAILAGCIVVGLLVWFFKREKFNDYKKYAIGIATGFAITMVVVFAYVKFQCNIDDMQAMLFYPILAMLIVVVAGGIAVLISSLFSNKAAKISLIVTGVLFLASFIALVVVVWKYYNIHFEEFKEMYPGMSLVGMVVSAVVILAVLVVLWFVGDKRKLNDTRSIVYGAVAMALAFVLSYARLFKLPNGGSITFASLLPLMIYCCMFGTRKRSYRLQSLRRVASASRPLHHSPDAILARLSSRIRTCRRERHLYGKGRFQREKNLGILARRRGCRVV